MAAAAAVEAAAAERKARRMARVMTQKFGSRSWRPGCTRRMDRGIKKTIDFPTVFLLFFPKFIFSLHFFSLFFFFSLSE